jgi:multisubunit Na+/H+ antiporter MnhE subunit
MTQARVLFYGLTVLFLVGVVVQFFLAGLYVFGSTSIESHRVLGFILAAAALLLIVLALVGRLPRRTVLLTVLLLGLSVLQSILANVDIDEVGALHPVNALVIAFVAYGLMQRSRNYLASKMAA